MLKAFQRLELPNEIQTQTDLRNLLRSKRLEFLSAIVNNTDVSNLEALISVELVKYEEVFFFTNFDSKTKIIFFLDRPTNCFRRAYIKS